MFFNTYPLFNKGRILKIEMLEQLRDLPREFMDIRLAQYSSGILSGCSIKANKDYIIVDKGIVKHNDMIYMLKEECIIPYNNSNKTVILKIKFSDETRDKDFIKWEAQIYIDDNLDNQCDEIELCRFTAKTGAILRTDYVSFKDMSTQYDTINIINSPFAANEKSGLSPIILRYFAKKAFQYNLTNALDICFCMQCLQSQQVLDRELLLNYIASRLKLELRDYSNEQIYENLLIILDEIEGGRKNASNKGRMGYKKIVVDV
ncbi:hypothetical protein LL037_14620 [Clostridium estertheticum]|uniref:hypothetical protein n=1 Tax=Clostridium estertheticum TaxID=238834 RepID=UPI001C0E164E|nr:hypothetical protein [Clostridium estertheticum]MBU3199018.1 hypothetical protein [Clostridium estertheticum]WAG63715.1 hypothetical protein LL037_14620 [Clostridium estertheticum]